MKDGRLLLEMLLALYLPSETTNHISWFGIYSESCWVYDGAEVVCMEAVERDLRVRTSVFQPPVFPTFLVDQAGGGEA